MLHVTNGSTAVSLLRAAGLAGEMLAWDDVLHEGPVPAGISFNQLRAVRARFIADCGWATYDNALRRFTDRDRALERALAGEEIVLWFEHDLFDQLQLIQLLDWFATCELGATRLSLICAREYLGPSTPERMRERFPTRVGVSDAQLDLARSAWRAFRAEDPTAIEALLRGDTSALPFLEPALSRHLQQFPSYNNGLSRTQQQALEIVAHAPIRLGDVFRRSHHDREDPVFLGDSAFALHVAAMSRVRTPLLLTEAGEPVRGDGVGPAFWNTSVVATDAGRAVLARRADHVTLNGVDRWLGGVQLVGDEAAWRWDEAAGQLRGP
jgi:hypothetical protein